MTENTETTVLLKCSRCGHEEKIPDWLLDEFNEMDEAYGSTLPPNTISCPVCGALMYEPHLWQNMPVTKSKLGSKTKKRKKRK